MSTIKEAVVPVAAAESSRYAWYAVSLLAIVNVVNYMDRMALSILLPDIKTDLQLTDTQLGLLTGMAFALFYAVFGIPIARWADRGTRRTIIALALTAWSVMTAISGAAQSFRQLFLARIGVGIGEAGCIPPSHSLISDYVPMARRPGAFALHTAGATTGIIVGLSLGGWLSDEIGWRWTFVALGIPGLILAFIVRFTLKEPSRGYSDGRAANLPAPSLREAVSYFLKCRTYLQLVLIVAIASLVNFGLNQWLPSFYVRTYGLSTAQVGFFFGVAYGLGATLGTLAGGVLANQLAKRDERWPLWLGCCSFLAALPLGLAMLLVPSARVALALNFAFAVVMCIPYGPMYAMAQNVIAPGMRTLASGISMFCASVIGIGGGPLIVGVTSDLLRPAYGDESLHYALLVPVLLLLWPALHFYLSARTLPRDLAMARQFHGG